MLNQLTTTIRLNRSRLHDLFLLRRGSERWIGIRERKSRGSRYSIVEMDMLLGRLIDSEPVGEHTIFHIVVPRNQNWKDDIFLAITNSAGWDVHFPYAPLTESGTEFVCPAGFWEECASVPYTLDAEEAHFRRHTSEVLGSLARPGATIYDPACSTGAFLGHIKDRHPGFSYIASDASNKMIELARDRFEDAFVSDVLAAQRLAVDCDIMILRFLNHEVMSSRDAEFAFLNMATNCKANGKIIAFGHTPLAIDLPKIVSGMKAEVVGSIGISVDPVGIFQYYIVNIL